MITRRTTGALAAAAALAVVLTGCGNNFSAQTNQAYQPAVGVVERGDGVDALNMQVVMNPDGSGTLAGVLIATGDDTDQLVDVAVAAGDSSLDVAFDGPLDIQTNELANLGAEGDVTITGDDLAAGQFVSLQLTFESAAAMSFQVPVVPRTELMPYDEVPTPSPTTEPTPTTEATG